MVSGTTIRTNCPRCGVVDITDSKAVSIGHDKTTYEFICPSCEEVVIKDADRKVVSLLVAAGVEVASPPLPPAPHVPPITPDEILDFHENIDSELDKLLDGDVDW